MADRTRKSLLQIGKALFWLALSVYLFVGFPLLVEAATTNYYIVADNGTTIPPGSTTKTNLASGNNKTGTYYTLFKTTTPSGSSTQLMQTVPKTSTNNVIGTIYNLATYGNNTSIAANPTGSVAISSTAGTSGTFSFALFEYDPANGLAAVPFATTSAISASSSGTSVVNIQFSSNAYLVPAGHSVAMVVYFSNAANASRSGSLYCNNNSSNSNSWITLNETPIIVTYSISTTAGTGGTISPANSPVIVNSGSSANFVFTPNAGYAIANVSVDGTSVGAVGSYSFNNITANHTLAVSFIQLLTITPGSGPNGTVLPSTPVVVQSGGSATFNIVANQGYAIQDVLVNGSSVGDPSSYTFSNVTANATITATFIAQSTLMNNYCITPPFLNSGVPPNVMILLSVETPMQGDAYPPITCSGSPSSSATAYSCTNSATVVNGRNVSNNYNNANSYSGYFDPDKCYSYSGSGSNGLFTPNGKSGNHQCSGSWSGNLLNFATTMSLDNFRIAFTGGNRNVDTTSQTVLLGGHQTLNPGNAWFPVKQISNANLYTPLTGSTIYLIRHDNGFTACSNTACAIDASENGYPDSSGSGVLGTYSLRVNVCNPSAGLEKNCNSSNNKPEGVLQRYAGKVRFGLFSYAMINNADATRDGGILRSNIKWLSPVISPGTKYHDASGAIVTCNTSSGCTNPEAEWDANGLFLSQPDAAAKALGIKGGLVNYINQFGYASGYKSYDPISELYYQSVRYFMNRGPSKNNYCNGISSSDDGFVAYCNNTAATSWRDPYLYACSQSSVISVSDANPWLDKRIPGTAFTKSYGGSNDYCSANCDTDMPELSGSKSYTLTKNGSTVSNSKTGTVLQYWTDKIGYNEGLTPGLIPVGCAFDGTTNCSFSDYNPKNVNWLSQAVGTKPYPGKENSYYVAGLSYFAHTNDLRPDLGGTAHTVSSYFIDTQEPSNDMLVGNQNMLFLAGKYGGFKDLDGNGVPYTDSTCGSSNPSKGCSEWDTSGQGFPDNYVFASDPTRVASALDNALSNILAHVASGTAASVLNSSQGSGANLLQGVFYPMKGFDSGTSVNWIGEIQNLWYYLDPFFNSSTIREDTKNDYVLDLSTDYILKFRLDSSQSNVVVDRYKDVNGDGKSITLVDSGISPDVINSLWRAGKMLWQRNLANDPRKIYTVASASPKTALVKFSTAAADNFSNQPTIQSWLQASNLDDANNIINYVSGIDQTGYRNRQVTILGCGLADSQACTREWKLGDIISSTPKMVSGISLNSYAADTPGGYGDSSYSSFTSSSAYQQRGMVFAGGNDGMLHAFKTGILDVSMQTYKDTKKIRYYSSSQVAQLTNTDGTTATSASNLGHEEWAFIPRNALPYLRYMGDTNYNHLYYVDNTVTLTDASIKMIPGDTTAGCDNAANYWQCSKGSSSWRSILIGGMGLGGASRDANTPVAATGGCDDKVSAGTCVKTPTPGIGYSSYFALDVTDPSTPSYLWEFSAAGQLGFALSEPAVVRVGPSSKNGRWFAVFGSGPTGPIDTTTHSFLATSDQNLKLFVVDIGTGALVRTIDTGIQNAFSGKISGATIDTDRYNPANPSFYSDDAVYVGYTNKAADGTWSQGGVGRLLTKGSSDPAQWVWSTVISNIAPVTTTVTKLQDRAKKKLWLYFGTGRYYYKSDRMNDQFKLYGIQEPCYSRNTGAPLYSDIGPPNALDSSCTTALTESALTNQTGAGSAPASSLAANSQGWYINLDTSALNDGYGSERLITNPVASTNGSVFFTTFRPTLDTCSSGGNSYLWALNYNSGSAPAASSMQGRALMQVSSGALAEVSLSSAFNQTNKNDPTTKYNRRAMTPAVGMPPSGSGMALTLNPKPIKRVLQIQEK